MATIVGLFDTLNTAQNAVNELVNKGFKRSEISLMSNASSNEFAHYFNAAPGSGQDLDIGPETTVAGPDRPLTAGEGTGFGAVAGAVTGVLVGLVAFVIPGIGPIIAAGPLIAGLTGGAVGAVAGAATGGVVAALVHAGVPEAEAGLYAQSVQRGGTLVLVRTSDDLAGAAQNVMRDYNAVDVVQRQGQWQSDDTAKLGTTAAASKYAVNRNVVPTTFNAACQQHYAEFYASKNAQLTYDQMLPFYRYGYNLATDPRYSAATWSDVEADAQHIWEQHNPTDTWATYHEAVHFGWDWVRQNNNNTGLPQQQEIPAVTLAPSINDAPAVDIGPGADTGMFGNPLMGPAVSI